MEIPKKLPIPNNTTSLLVVLLIIAAFAIGVLWTKVQYLEGKGGTAVAGTGTNPAPRTNPQAAPTPGKIKPVSDNDHIRGDKNAKVTLVEYSDFQCPFCKQFHPTMQQVMKDYQGKVRWVYREFPLEAIHPRARPAANAAECVSALGGNDKFWAYADKLFEGAPESLTDDKFKEIAVSIGIDGAKLQDCYSNKKYDNKIGDDLKDGQTGGITGTPGTVVIDAKGNSSLIPGALPLDNVKQTIDAALKNN